jgi:WD40 repeat protein
VDWFGAFLALGGAAGSGGAQVRVFQFDGASLSQIDAATPGGTVFSINWHPSGNFLAIGGDSGTGGIEVRVYAFDGHTLTAVPGSTLDLSSRVTSIAWSPDGAALATAEVNPFDPFEFKIFSFDGSLFHALPNSVWWYGGEISSISFSPTHDFVTIVGSGATYAEVMVFVFDGINIAMLSFIDHDAPLYSVSWHPGGLSFVAGGASGPAGIDVLVAEYTMNVGFQLSSTYNHGGVVGSVEWRPESNFFAIGGNVGINGTEIGILAFDPATNTITLVETAVHGATVNDVAWTENGTGLASGGDSLAGTGPEIRVWGTETVPVELSSFIVK